MNNRSITTGCRWRRLGAGLAIATVAAAGPAVAQETRADEIARRQAEKATVVRPYEANKAEEYVNRAEEILLSGKIKWHPWFESAYAGGSFTLGAGYRAHVSGYNTLDVRGSYTILGYKRLETEFLAPRLFNRRGVLSVLGGWREATQVGYYGLGTAETSSDDRANYEFSQPYASATLDFWPTRRLLVLTGGLEFTEWRQSEGGGSAPSVEEVYTPETAPGLGSSPTYLHATGGIALDWRPAAGYARSGGYYGVAIHDFSDRDDTYSFRRVDYEAIQHLPILNDAWVLSLRGRVQTTDVEDGRTIPFFMLPAVGGGSSLRGFSSWRFRDRHTLLLSADWRVLVNRFLDVAVFCDAGKAVASKSDLDLDGLKKDYGLGFRFHGPAATPLRIEFAKSNEGLSLVFSAKAAF